MHRDGKCIYFGGDDIEIWKQSSENSSLFLKFETFHTTLYIRFYISNLFAVTTRLDQKTFFSKNLYLLIDVNFVHFKVYIVHLCYCFSNFRGTSGTQFSVWLLAPSAILRLFRDKILWYTTSLHLKNPVQITFTFNRTWRAFYDLGSEGSFY